MADWWVDVKLTDETDHFNLIRVDLKLTRGSNQVIIKFFMVEVFLDFYHGTDVDNEFGSARTCDSYGCIC